MIQKQKGGLTAIIEAINGVPREDTVKGNRVISETLYKFEDSRYKMAQER